MDGPCVYILANARRGTLFLGVTASLPQRLWWHRDGASPSFTRRYRAYRLVWFEPQPSMQAALAREKALRRWRRGWKVSLVEAANPDWRDLAPRVAAPGGGASRPSPAVAAPTAVPAPTPHRRRAYPAPAPSLGLWVSEPPPGEPPEGGA